MKTLFVTFICTLISISAISQEIGYKKDVRPQNIKEDRFNDYQIDRISDVDILQALELAGVRMFVIPISPVFEKEYYLSVNLNEYVNGEKINTTDIIRTYKGENVYLHFEQDSIQQKEIFYFDYIPKLTFFSKDNDTTLLLRVSHLGGSSSIPLKKDKERSSQSYHWRAYSKTDWKLNEEVPLLVYASSWFDEKMKMERFCGAGDLSLNESATKELLDNSPHYYVISLKVFE